MSIDSSTSRKRYRVVPPPISSESVISQYQAGKEKARLGNRHYFREYAAIYILASLVRHLLGGLVEHVLVCPQDSLGHISSPEQKWAKTSGGRYHHTRIFLWRLLGSSYMQPDLAATGETSVSDQVFAETPRQDLLPE